MYPYTCIKFFSFHVSFICNLISSSPNIWGSYHHTTSLTWDSWSQSFWIICIFSLQRLDADASLYSVITNQTVLYWYIELLTIFEVCWKLCFESIQIECRWLYNNSPLESVVMTIPTFTLYDQWMCESLLLLFHDNTYFCIVL